jgi:hypothetical protein
MKPLPLTEFSNVTVLAYIGAWDVLEWDADGTRFSILLDQKHQPFGGKKAKLSRSSETSGRYDVDARKYLPLIDTVCRHAETHGLFERAAIEAKARDARERERIKKFDEWHKRYQQYEHENAPKVATFLIRELLKRLGPDLDDDDPIIYDARMFSDGRGEGRGYYFQIERAWSNWREWGYRYLPLPRDDDDNAS